MNTPALLAMAVLLSFGLTGEAQQDTAKAKSDTSAVKASNKDTLALKPKPEPRQAAAYKIDTTFEAINLERYYYGMDGIDGTFDQNPWEEFLFQDADEREAAEREQRDQERDTRE